MAPDQWHKTLIGLGVFLGLSVLVPGLILLGTKLYYKALLRRVQRPYDGHELGDLSHRRDLERGDVGGNGPGESTLHRVELWRGDVEPVIGGALLIHDDDDETQLIPSGAPLDQRRNSKRRGKGSGKGKGKGKGKARAVEIKEDADADAEVFSLSPIEGPRGSGDLYLVPTPVTANRPRGRSITSRPVLSALFAGSRPGPSRPIKLPDPSEFELAETTFWKPAVLPKDSRYRGLSATTRPKEKPLPASPPQSLPVEKDKVQVDSLPLPDPEAFDLSNRPDSWENFSDNNEDYYDSDEWTSQVCTTVLVGPRQAEASRATSLAARLVGGDAPAAAAAAAPANNNNNNNNNNHPAWELGGPSPDPRVLTRKATLPGRQTKFLEVDIDGLHHAATAHSPVEKTVFQECLELLREGARTPDIITELGVGWEEEVDAQPALFRGNTWSISGALSARRRETRDGGEGSSKPKITKSKTSQV